LVPEWVLVPGGGLGGGGARGPVEGWCRSGGAGAGVGSIVGHALLLAGRI